MSISTTESLAEDTKAWSERADKLEESLDIILEGKGLFSEAKMAEMARYDPTFVRHSPNVVGN